MPRKLRGGLRINHLSQKVHIVPHKIHRRFFGVFQNRSIQAENTGLIFAIVIKLDFRKCLTSVMRAYILCTKSVGDESVLCFIIEVIKKDLRLKKSLTRV